MNTLQKLQKPTLGHSTGSKGNTYAYRVGNGIYINLTNRCTNDCIFCIRRNGDRAYGSNTLWLDHEPSAEEAFAAVQKLYFPECREFVFCGYGEPMIRLDTLLLVAEMIRASYRQPIRINTNGQANLFFGEDITPRLEHLIDDVSISLNASSPREYVRICQPVYGEKAYSSMLEFAGECKKHVPATHFTIVDGTMEKYELAMCYAIADRCRIPLRVREYIGFDNN